MTGEEASRRTRRWRGVVAVTLVAVGVALLTRRPTVLLLAVFGVAFASYPLLTAPPEPALVLDRRVSDERPAPGDAVSVTVTVRNAGDETLPDLRVVDGVPAALRVTGGSPRRGTALRPGRAVSFTYEVVTERGTHRFDPATVVARDVSGGHEVETTVADETELACGERVANPTLRSQTLPSVGEIPSDRGGSGVEFHRTREYRRGDPVSRIDWRRYAKTGEPTTIDFRREQSAAVVVAVDARPAAYRGRAGEPHAVTRGVSAARQFVETLSGGRNAVGLAGFGRELVWVAPRVGREQADDLHRTLATHETFAATPPAEVPPHESQVDAVRARVETGTQVLLVSPLCDDAPVTTARQLDVTGHPVSVVSPRVTRTDSPGRRLATAERRRRVRRLRTADVPVVEWEADEPLAAAVAAFRRGRLA